MLGAYRVGIDIGATFMDIVVNVGDGAPAPKGPARAARQRRAGGHRTDGGGPG